MIFDHYKYLFNYLPFDINLPPLQQEIWSIFPLFEKLNDSLGQIVFQVLILSVSKSQSSFLK